MKNVKKVLALALASVMAFATVACGNEGTPAVGTESGKTAAAGPWRIGGIGPTTGGAAVYGQAVQNGAQIAVDEINAAGGINGVMIEYTFEDDENNAEKGVNAYNSLKDWGMQMLLGTVTTTPCIAVSAEAAADNMYLLTPSGSSTDILEGKTNAFQVCFTDPNQGQGSAQYIGENNMASKVAVIYDSSSAYSQGIYEKFAQEAKNYSFEIVSAEAFTADSNTDFSVQLQKAKDAGAELLFLPIYYQEAALILDQAKKADFAPIFFGCDGLDGILSVEGFDTALAEGVMLLTPFVADEDKELTKNFVAAYDEQFGGVPNQFAADAYDGIYAIKAAVEKAGIKADMSESDICEALKKAMLEVEVPGLTGTMTWDASGEPTKDPKAVKIVDGAYTAM